MIFFHFLVNVRWNLMIRGYADSLRVKGDNKLQPCCVGWMIWQLQQVWAEKKSCQQRNRTVLKQAQNFFVLSFSEEAERGNRELSQCPS